jgi:signal transduction histidine kinase
MDKLGVSRSTYNHVAKEGAVLMSDNLSAANPWPLGAVSANPSARSCLTVRSQLIRLVLAGVLPIWMAGIVVAFSAYQSKRALCEHDLLEAASTIRQTVDRELVAAQSSMNILATSPPLAAGDVAAFDRQARLVLKEYPGAAIILADASGQQLVNTDLPTDSPLPLPLPLPVRNATDTVRRIFETGKPIVSDLFIGAVSKQYAISIDVPVFIDGHVAYDLGITMPANSLMPLLGDGTLRAEWVRTIFDSAKMVVVRSHHPETFVGHNGGSAFPASMFPHGLAQDAVVEIVSLDGVPTIAAFSRSTASGWTAAVGAPKAVLFGDLEEWLSWISCGGLFLSLVSLGLASIIGRRIAGSFQVLTGPARALGQSETVSLPPTPIREANEVAAALAEAAAQLEQRDAERSQAERDLHAARLEAEAANASKSRFIAAASHDLRQPLQALGMFLSVLAARLGEPYQGLMANLGYCHDNLSELLNDMLDISKLDSGVITTNIVPFPLGELLERVAATHQPQARSKGLSLRVVTTKDVVHSDPALLHRVLTNFLSNAVRYTRNGGVLIGCRRHQGRRWIEVWDTGIGIPADRVGDIFEEFCQLGHSECGYEAGSGLGLAIVRKAAALLGGEIHVSSVPGKGSVFAIELPAA